MPSNAPIRLDTPDEATLVLGARRCAPMGRLDYLVQVGRPGAQVRTWYVVAPDPSAWRGPGAATPPSASTSMPAAASCSTPTRCGRSP
jgi:hypothetical protein